MGATHCNGATNQNFLEPRTVARVSGGKGVECDGIQRHRQVAHLVEQLEQLLVLLEFAAAVKQHVEGDDVWLDACCTKSRCESDVNSSCNARLEHSWGLGKSLGSGL